MGSIKLRNGYHKLKQPFNKTSTNQNASTVIDAPLRNKGTSIKMRYPCLFCVIPAMQSVIFDVPAKLFPLMLLSLLLTFVILWDIFSIWQNKAYLLGVCSNKNSVQWLLLEYSITYITFTII